MLEGVGRAMRDRNRTVGQFGNDDSGLKNEEEDEGGIIVLFLFICMYLKSENIWGDRQIPDATDTTQSGAAEAETEGCGTYSVEYNAKDMVNLCQFPSYFDTYFTVRLTVSKMHYKLAESTAPVIDTCVPATRPCHEKQSK